MTERPSVFIGSSKEGLPIAEAFQQNLDYVCEATIWSQGVFGLGEGTLEALVNKLPEFDFAILALTPDDLTLSRESNQPSPRDNVLLELGMCLGALGRDRVFAVFDRSAELKLPSDLAGVSLATYQPHSSGNLQSSLGAACTEIKNAVSKLGRRPRTPFSTNVTEDTTFQIIHDLLDDPAEQFMILMFEQKTSINRKGNPPFGIPYAYEFQSGKAGSGAFSIDKMCEQLPDAGFLTQDLRGNVSLTQHGERFVDWLLKRGFKADAFASSIGQWGEITGHVRAFIDRSPFWEGVSLSG